MINLQNFYKDTLKTDVTFVGVGKIYVNIAKPTVTPGIVVISPNSGTLREIIQYTATGADATGDYIEVTDAGHRGLGGTTAQTHKQLEPVRINVTKEHFDSIFVSPTFTGNVTVPTPTNPSDAVTKAFAEGLANAGGADASTTVQGLSRLSTAPGTTLGTATMTIASPCVVSFTGHGLTLNDIVKFSTTIALPTGITAGTPYYVISAGLTADAFQISASQGGSGVNTSGTQSGVHTLIKITPTSISDTDPRLPTQNENDALVGLAGTPSTSNPFATKQSLDLFIPLATMFDYGGSTAPNANWLLCQGQAISRTTYATLFAVIGTTYGVGDGSTTFNVPNYKGKVAVMQDSGQTEFDTLGETGGAKTHTLTLSETPAHSHIVTGIANGNSGPANSAPGSASGNSNYSNATNPGTDSQGGGGSHNNLQPYLVANRIIRAI